MHLLLTDRLTCPRCGPAFGLILLADRVEERRVLEGWLGCPNCRDRYPVREGFGDLRPPPRGALPDGAEGEVDEAPDEATVQGLAAALGVGPGGGTTLTLGDAVRFAAPLAALLPELEVAALDVRTRHWPEQPGVSRLAGGDALPFFGGMLRGVALGAGDVTPEVASEAARVLAPLHRLVVLDPPSEADGLAEFLRSAGLPQQTRGPGMLVAGR